jgi:hypothetical protein
VDIFPSIKILSPVKCHELKEKHDLRILVIGCETIFAILAKKNSLIPIAKNLATYPIEFQTKCNVTLLKKHQENQLAFKKKGWKLING